jgi:hypothetical protein
VRSETVYLEDARETLLHSARQVAGSKLVGIPDLPLLEDSYYGGKCHATSGCLLLIDVRRITGKPVQRSQPATRHTGTVAAMAGHSCERMDTAMRVCAPHPLACTPSYTTPVDATMKVASTGVVYDVLGDRRATMSPTSSAPTGHDCALGAVGATEPGHDGHAGRDGGFAGGVAAHLWPVE